MNSTPCCGPRQKRPETAEWLWYRVPADFIDPLPKIERVFPHFEDAHHSS